MSPTTTRQRKPVKRRAPSRAPARAPARRPAKAPARRPSPTLTSRMARAISGQRHGVGAVTLLVLAGIGGAGLYAHALGPAGEGMAWVLKGILGWVAPALPPLFAFIAIQILRGETESAGRVTVGGLLTLIGIAAFRQIIWAHDANGLQIEALGQYGGVLGAGAAWPLQRAITPVGAGIFAALLTGVGVMVTTRTPFSKVVAGTRTGSAAAARGFAVAAREVCAQVAEGARWAWPRVKDLGRNLRALRGSQPRPTPEPDDGDGPLLEIAPPVWKPPAPEPAAKRPSPELADPASWEQPALPGTTPPGTAAPAKAPASKDGYRLPPAELLSLSGAAAISKAAIEETIKVLERTLSEFQVDAHVTGFTPGPTVTRYEIELGAAVKVNRVVGLQNEIRYALAAGELRILAPIPGRSAIGIEVPNRDRHVVTLGDVLRSPELRAMNHPLTVGLGKDISGTPVGVSLADMPHLLIAGATGSGKSTCINAMLISILARARPDQVRMLLIDPKWVELSQFNGVPHLLTPVVTSPKKAAEALNWVVKEMEARYEVLAMAGMRNCDMYNDAVRAGALGDAFDDGTPRSPYPYYLIVVDELADLMMVAPRDVEDAICRIAQKARAVGIHLLVATQRPSVDVVTGVIKANIPSRMAFATASLADSRVILDEAGADRLIGHGDMLYKHASAARPRRLQGAYVSEQEIEAVIGWCRRQRNVDYVEGIVSETQSIRGGTGAESDEDEVLLRSAMELVVTSRLGSTSMLQRKLKVGFSRAGRLMDLLEQRGVVGMSQGSKPRDVLMTFEEWQEEEAARRVATREPVLFHDSPPPAAGPPDDLLD
ncbi:MAG TPA: DNA translocase FtsK [Actinomycetota bacterium]|nr:DNA translocase FtsK [Actinomycetota bacterium]